jgi:hypothetical protein
VFRKLEHVMPFSWNKINTCNNTSHIFPCVDSTTIAWTIRACQQCGSCKRLQVFSIVFLTGICCASGRSPVTGIQGSRKAQITNIRAAFSIYFLQQQSVSTLVCLKKRATACNCPLFCSCFPPSDFGPVRWQICHHMSPFTHAEIDTLESAGEIPIHHTEAVEWSDCAGSARRHPMAGE